VWQHVDQLVAKHRQAARFQPDHRDTGFDLRAQHVQGAGQVAAGDPE
jgi:hypothetical protein